MTRDWLTRLWQRNRADGAASGAASVAQQDPLLAAGTLLREAREARGLTLRQLALDTRISTPVLEALERGWRERLPETAYLRTMLPLLERHLELERGSLRQALLQAGPLPSQGRGASARMPLLSVQVFSTWQGTALYGALMLLLLYALNWEQRRLAAQGLMALNPVPPLPEQVLSQRATPGAERLLTLHPELRPLARPRLVQAMAVLRTQAGAAATSRPNQPQVGGGAGLLSLQLSRPSRLELWLADGGRSTLPVGAGELVLPLQAPIELRIAPPPGATEAVLWNGAELKPQVPGRYRWQRTAISP